MASNTELQSRLDYTLAELDAVKTKAQPAKVRKLALHCCSQLDCAMSRDAAWVQCTASHSMQWTAIPPRFLAIKLASMTCTSMP